jgi:hypothetical protein
MFRTDAWAQFFPDDQTPPILIANVLDPCMKFEDSPQIITLDFDADGIFDYHCATDPDHIRTLHRLGAEWDEGTGFVPYAPPPPRYAYVWRRFPVHDLPTRRPFRDMQTYMAADWGQAVSVAIQAIEANVKSPTWCRGTWPPRRGRCWTNPSSLPATQTRFGTSTVSTARRRCSVRVSKKRSCLVRGSSTSPRCREKSAG